MLNIVSKQDPIQIQSLCLMIYGQPGIGKTSIGFTAENPLLLDFDQGAHRSRNRGDSVQIAEWKDVENMKAEDLEGYDTIIVDTVGRLLDLLSVDIISKNPKMKGYGGALSLQGYGALKSSYATWLKVLLSYGKDVMLIAHEKEDKNGDELIMRPDIQGGSGGEVFKRADGVAFMYKSGKQTLLDFNPTEQWQAKNAAGLLPLEVPNFTTKPDYLATVISDIKGSINALSAEQTEALAVVDKWRLGLHDVADADGINKSINDVQGLSGVVQKQVKALIVSRADELGLMFNKEEKLYEIKEVA